MNDILQDLSPTSLSIAVEKNLSSWMPVFGKQWKVIEGDPPGTIRSLSPVAVSLFNSVMEARLEPDQVEAAIRFITADAEQRQVPVLWWVGPSTVPPGLGKTLQKYGFIIDDDDPGMAVELAKLNKNLPVAAGVTIEVVTGDSALREWCQAMAHGFEAPPSKVDFIVDAWHNFLRIVDREITVVYLARLDGKPVATSILQLGAGVAGIYAVGTIPQARRKGIGAQVTLVPLLHARSKGYKAGVLGASEMGFPVYRKLGFREYCRISSYVYRPQKG